MNESTLSHVARDELDVLYHGRGLTMYEIGQLFGVSDEVVRYRMNQLGIERRSKSEAASGPRPKARRLHLGCDELKGFYVTQGLNTFDIGEMFGVAPDTVRRHLEECGVERRDKSASAIQYTRNDFSGNECEKAYLHGFRQGDLWVKPTNDGSFSTTITVTCTSTRQEQIDLFYELFSPYGHVYISPAYNGNSVMLSHVNRSFEFLLVKQDIVPLWIVNDPTLFVAFLAGYTDAEGCFNVPADDRGIFRLQSYDITTLNQIHEMLNNHLGVQCPPPRLAIPKGYLNSDGYRLRKDCWGLTVKRKVALYRLCRLLESHIKHRKRKADMAKVLQNVIARGLEEDEQQ